jgi:hypothetical protein
MTLAMVASSALIQRFTIVLINRLVTLMKEKQNACARCRIEISDLMFGAIGHECDHIEENDCENNESNKQLELGLCGGERNVTDTYDGLNKIVKTQLTCGFFHYRVKYSILAELPIVLTRKYVAIQAQAVSVYLDSAEGISMFKDFNQAWHDDLLE